MSRDAKTAMDTQTGREFVPAAPHRLHGADRGGLGADGWAEVPDDLVGDPDDANVPPEFYEPPSETKPPDQPL
jgi:hypothetical protein